MFDLNGDGTVDAEEFEKVTTLLRATSRYGTFDAEIFEKVTTLLRSTSRLSN